MDYAEKLAEKLKEREKDKEEVSTEVEVCSLDVVATLQLYSQPTPRTRRATTTTLR